jgi:hypothetical protein
MDAGVRGLLRRCQLRQRLPGENHTVVGATAVLRTVMSETKACTSVAASFPGSVVMNNIRFLPN